MPSTRWEFSPRPGSRAIPAGRTAARLGDPRRTAAPAVGSRSLRCMALQSLLPSIVRVSLRAAAMLVLACGLAHAAVPPATVAAPAAVRAPASAGTATARFFNRDIVTFRSRFLGNTPEMRARATESNIERIVEAPGQAQPSDQMAPQGVVVMLDGQLVTVVTPADLDALRNQTMEQARADILARLGDAVRAAETARAPQRVLQGIGWSLLATVVVFFALWLLQTIRLRIRHRVSGWVTDRVEHIHNESMRGLALAFVATARGLVRVLSWIVALVVIEEWLRFCFSHFAYTQPWSGLMTEWVDG